VRASEMLIKDLDAYSLTTVSSLLASFSNRGKYTVLSECNSQIFPSSSAIAKSTSSSSWFASAEK
jgi:hypothetical protein